MRILHLVHGLPGSGKTTFARKLARELPAVRFTPDEWMGALLGANPPEAIFRPQHTKIMALIWEHAERVLRAGTDAILDAGFWSRASRDEARKRAAEIGVAWRFYAVPCTAGEARRRVLARTAALPPGALEISSHTFDFLLAQFEPMGSGEPHVVVPGQAGPASLS